MSKEKPSAPIQQPEALTLHIGLNRKDLFLTTPLESIFNRQLQRVGLSLDYTVPPKEVGSELRNAKEEERDTVLLAKLDAREQELYEVKTQPTMLVEFSDKKRQKLEKKANVYSVIRTNGNDKK